MPSDLVTVTVTLDRREMARRGRIGGLVTRLKHDPRVTTGPARRAFLSRFRSDEERREHFRQLGLASAKTRRARAGVAA